MCWYIQIAGQGIYTTYIQEILPNYPPKGLCQFTYPKAITAYSSFLYFLLCAPWLRQGKFSNCSLQY